jgi:hypothetical protein
MKNKRKGVKIPAGWVPHDELWELYDLDVKRRDFVTVPAMQMNENMQVKGYKRRIDKEEKPMKSAEALAAFAEKLEDEGLREELLGLVEGLEPPEPKEEPKQPDVAEAIASIQTTLESLNTRFDELGKPPEPKEEEPNEEEAASEEEEEETVLLTDEELAEVAETVETLTEAGENGELDEEGIETLTELSAVLETYAAEASPAA